MGPPPLLAPVADDVDVAVIGAGAAGIGAARHLLASGRSCAVVEARGRVGGRVVTADLRGHPVDLGAHWLHAGAVNPLVALAKANGRRVRPAPGRSALFVDGRPASRADRRANGRAFEALDRAIENLLDDEEDGAIAGAMPPLGRFGRAIAATMTLISGRPLHEVSAYDFPSEEFGDNYFVVGGYGRFLSGLASGLPVALATTTLTIDWSGSGVAIGTDRGTIRARAALVTVPVPVLQGGRMRFKPDLPEPTREAIARFLPGTYEHVVVNWPSCPVGGRDRLAKFILGRHTLGAMTWMDAAPFHYVELDHATVAGTPNPAARAALARDVLRRSFGARAVADLRTIHVTDWLSDPDSLGSWAVIPPGHAPAREALAQPVGERVWFAGEATSRAMWGTAGGAWEEGVRAARAIDGALGAGIPPVSFVP